MTVQFGGGGGGGGASSPTVLISNATTEIPLIIRGIAGQTADLQQWQDSAGTVKAKITAAGNLAFFGTSVIQVQAGGRFYSDVFQSATTGYMNMVGTLRGNGDAPVVISNPDPGQIKVVVKAAASQTANLQEWQDSTAAVKLAVTPAGMIYGGISSTLLGSNGTNTNYGFGGSSGYPAIKVGSVITALFSANGMEITPYAAGNVGLYLKRNLGQTGNLLETPDYSDAISRFAINAAGLPKWNRSDIEQTTVGAAGGASALPATPTKYLKVVDSAGTTLVIPAYAAS